MTMKPKNIPCVLEYNGKTYKITGLCEAAGPTMRGPNVEAKLCYAQFLYNGKWFPVRNLEIKVDLREIYDSQLD